MDHISMVAGFYLGDTIEDLATEFGLCPTDVERVVQPDTFKARRAASFRAWRSRNPEVHKARTQNWFALSVGAGGRRLTASDWKEMCEFWGACAYCNRPGRLWLDHIQPLSCGGSHDLTNLCPACQSCNSSKGAKVNWRPAAVKRAIQRASVFAALTRTGRSVKLGV